MSAKIKRMSREKWEALSTRAKLVLCRNLTDRWHHDWDMAWAESVPYEVYLCICDSHDLTQASNALAAVLHYELFPWERPRPGLLSRLKALLS